jgi:hypothetical protein
LGIVDRQNDGNEGFLINLISHKYIYRLLQIYPFVKYYRGIG